MSNTRSNRRTNTLASEDSSASGQRLPQVSGPDPNSVQFELVERLLREQQATQERQQAALIQAQQAQQTAAQQQQERFLEVLIQQQQQLQSQRQAQLQAQLDQQRAQQQQQERLFQLYESTVAALREKTAESHPETEEPRRRTPEIHPSPIPTPRRLSLALDQVPHEGRRWSGQLPSGIQRRSSRPLSILVEGNIGCGKTTFTSRFLKDKNILTLLEPLDEYRNVAGVNLLEMMYKDPTRHAYHFQHLASMIMRDRHRVQTTLRTKIMERSIYSANCFVEARRRMGGFEEFEAFLLTESVNKIVEKSSDFEVDLIVYLRLSPEISYSRVCSRARSEEDQITLDYLKILHEVHDDWLVKGKFSSLPAPVLILNAEAPADDVYKKFCEVMNL